MATVRALISARSAGLPGAFPFSGCGWIMNATCSPSLSASSTLVEEIRCASRTLLPGPTTQALVPRACYPKTADRGVSSNFGASDRACPWFRTDRSPVQPARKSPPRTRGRRKPGDIPTGYRRCPGMPVREHCPGDVRQSHPVHDPPLDVRRPDLPRAQLPLASVSSSLACRASRGHFTKRSVTFEIQSNEIPHSAH